MKATAARERVEEFGRSVQKRPLRVYVLESGQLTGDNAPDVRNVTLIFAAVHGNETSTPGVVERLRAHLKKHGEILNGRRVLLVPIMNPDGLARGTRRNARDVDINRNYPGTWRRPRRGETFRSGTAAASEPETRAMMGLVARYKPDKIVSIHQPLGCLIFSGALSRPLALAMQKANRYAIRANAGYPTPGGFGGYCEKIIRTPVVTLELPRQSAQAAWNANARALISAIQQRFAGR